ncbi:CAP domain-containing protein [Terriglobus tenax]|uniref:CAP domain-containing protein n=1 Tax=Terriglobus tenax TaxID=1111115 RepID=UPI0021E00DE5|nr:CAP domain-containing protein [Terriglobus tenax]
MRFRFLLTSLLFVIAGRTVHAQSSLAERYLFQALNQERTQAGLSPLHWDQHLYSAARYHAGQMAAAGAITHQFEGEPDLSERVASAGGHVSVVAENVAMAPTAVRVHDGWMHSPHHRENILDPRVTSVGIAVVARGRELYAVQDFSRDVPTLSFPQQEQAVIASLRSLRLNATSSQAARDNCVLDSGVAGGSHPLFVMRWTATDLDSIPDQLKSRLRQRRYNSAEVGACPAPSQGSFTTYRIAVLMY